MSNASVTEHKSSEMGLLSPKKSLQGISENIIGTPSEAYNVDDLSGRGEIFKTKIIRMFHLLDFVDDEGEMNMRTEVPELQTSDITDTNVSSQTLKYSPNSLVQFRVYKTKVNQSPCSSPCCYHLSYSDRSSIIIIITRHLYCATKCRNKLSGARLSNNRGSRTE